MSFTVMDPDPFKRVEIAIDDVRAGKIIILIDDEDRENEGDLTMAADRVTPEAINFMATHGRGLICLTMTEERVAQLGLPMMAAHNQSPYQTAFTVSIEAREGVSTGISAADRARTIQVAIDPERGPQDIVVPGHISRCGLGTAGCWCGRGRPRARWTWPGWRAARPAGSSAR